MAVPFDPPRLAAAERSRFPAIVLLLLLPTAWVVWQLLVQLNAYVGILQDQAGIGQGVRLLSSVALQALAFCSGMFLAAWLHSYRFRFLPIYVVLVAVAGLVYTLLDSIALGEFDFFFLSVSFLTYSVLFCFGWLVGWGFVRWRSWAFLIGLLLLVGSVVATSRMPGDVFPVFAWRLFLPILYTLYLIFTAEQIHQYAGRDKRFWPAMLRRLLIFALLVGGLSLLVFTLFEKNLQAAFANRGGTGKGGDNSMTQKDKEGNHSMKSATSLQSGLKRNNELVFAAHIENYFPETNFPNPLYLTTFYYTLFDEATETFERDSLLPAGDLFSPNVAQVPLFRTLTDSAVYRKAKRYEQVREIEIEVYSKKLSPSGYYAPQTGYLVQPITVDKEFRREFRRAYRARSVSSDLNSAYFVYNAADNAEIQAFQEQRFEVLRGARRTDDDLPAGDVRYYTTMPANPKWQPIGELARKLARGKSTRIDQVLAIRDHFLSKDSAGQPLFRYADNPGIPDIPSASRLLYFLFENRQGYCAYFAGATLFMLRSLGIPSRIAVGYLTVDRSGGKNKGWYWYYADQAHAWVQVYFPGFGWLDFDTTVGNDEAQESPQPDGTPPVQPPKAIFSAEGIALSTDTLQKQLSLRTSSVLYREKPISGANGNSLVLDVGRAAFMQDTLAVNLAALKPGDTLTAVSYDPNYHFPETVTAAAGKAWPVDEVYVRPLVTAPPKTEAESKTQQRAWGWQQKLLVGALLMLVLTGIWLMIPRLLRWRLERRLQQARSPKEKAFRAFEAASYYLHMMGHDRGERSPAAFAAHTDELLQSQLFGSFVQVYQKARFSRTPLTSDEETMATTFYPKLRRSYEAFEAGKIRQRKWLRPVVALRFLLANS